MPSRSRSAAPPANIRRAGVVVALEGLVAVVVAIVMLVVGLGGGKEASFAYGGGYWFGIIGLGVLAGGWALFTGRRWGRAIAVVAQILLLPVAFALLTDSHQPWYGAPMLVVVVIVLGLLFSPSSVRWLAADYSPDAEPAADQPENAEPQNAGPEGAESESAADPHPAANRPHRRRRR